LKNQCWVLPAVGIVKNNDPLGFLKQSFADHPVLDIAVFAILKQVFLGVEVMFIASHK